MTELTAEIRRRRTFAIISHPDAGKTTLTEKLLLFGGAIQMAGTVKGRKAARHATSDWMRLEQQRGISVTSSVMQFPYRDCIVNLLDTPGHEDFSEDTYRTLTAVDSALMVIDCAKGVEERTIKLMEVCRLRDTPIMTFINKLDREGRAPIELLDEIEKVLGIATAPVTWPIGMGQGAARHLSPAGGSHLRVSGGRARPGRRESGHPGIAQRCGARVPRRAPGRGGRGDRAGQGRDGGVRSRSLPGRPADAGVLRLGDQQLRRGGAARDVHGACAGSAGPRDPRTAGGAARGGAVGVRVQDPGEHGSGAPRSHRVPAAVLGQVHAGDAALSRRGSARRCGWRMRSRSWRRSGSMRRRLSRATSSGCTTTGRSTSGIRSREGEKLAFTGVPNFAPEIFRRAVLKDPLKMKALQKGLSQLCEEGATQLFKPVRNNELILGAVGQLQFEVVAFRLQDEYGVQCVFEPVSVHTARWVDARDGKKLEEFRVRAHDNLAVDHAGALVYLAPTSGESAADFGKVAGYYVSGDARARCVKCGHRTSLEKQIFRDRREYVHVGCGKNILFFRPPENPFQPRRRCVDAHWGSSGPRVGRRRARRT